MMNMKGEFEIKLYDSYPWNLARLIDENDIQKMLKSAFSIESLEKINSEIRSMTGAIYKYKLILRDDVDMNEDEVKKALSGIHRLFEGVEVRAIV